MGKQRNLLQKLTQWSLEGAEERQSDRAACIPADHDHTKRIYISTQYSHSKNAMTNSGKSRSLA